MRVSVDLGGEELSDEAVDEPLGMPAERAGEAMAQPQTAQILSLDDYLPQEDRGEARKANLIQDPAARPP